MTTRAILTDKRASGLLFGSSIPLGRPLIDPAALPESPYDAVLPLPSASGAPYTFRFTAGEARVFRPRERDPRTGLPVTVSAWADHYRRITEGGRQGPWSTAFAAYTRFPMDAWNLPWVHEISLCWAPQSSKTQVALNCVGYSIDQDPGPVLWTAANENKAGDAMTKKLRKMVDSSDRLREILAPRGNTRLSLSFNNGASVNVAWAGSAAQLASDSYKYGVSDETDKYEQFTGKEADPDSLIDQRFISYHNTYKHLRCSTPARESGIIWRALTEEADEVYDYEARCPICGRFQVMLFENISWPSDVRDPSTIFRRRLAAYTCGSCGMKWTDRLRNDAVAAGRWRARNAVPDGRPAHVAFHLPSWYSPFVSLSRVVAAHLRGLDDSAKHMAFVTQHRAEAYTERVDNKQEDEVLTTHRVEKLAACTAPADTIAISCGYDSHKDYFKFTAWAWNANFDATLIEYGVLPALEDVEEHVFETRYDIDGSNDVMAIWRAAIDIGGGKGKPDSDMTQTAAIEEWLLKVKRRGVVFAVKGASHSQSKRIHFSLIGAGPKGKKNRRLEAGKIELRILDTDRFKIDVHNYIDREKGKKRRMFLHFGTADDFVRELLAEQLHRDRRGNTFWKKIRTANHYFDCTVYAFACADPEWLPSLSRIAARRRIRNMERIAASPGPVPDPQVIPGVAPVAAPLVPSDPKERARFRPGRRVLNSGVR
jgi:phage terminase large subunit GpA-like protein